MKTIYYIFIVCISLLLAGGSAHGREVKLLGSWEGVLQVGQQSVPILFHIQADDSGLVATMDSPAQGATGIPVTSVIQSGDKVLFEIAAAGARYEAVYVNNELKGVWKQSAQEFVLNMARKGSEKRIVKKTMLNRPQEPSEPYPYETLEVNFTNKAAGVALAGTLSVPRKPVSDVVILISGSGPQDRDQVFMGHKTFLVLSDFLARKGIAVLRYDDRGVGNSTGSFNAATSYDFAEDASAAVDYLASLAEFRNSRIGLIGHSEGGLVAPIVATRNAHVDYSVLMAAPSLSGRFVSENQMYRILKSAGLSEDVAHAGTSITRKLNETVLTRKEQDPTLFAEQLRTTYAEAWSGLSSQTQQALKRVGGGALTDARIQSLSSAWYRTFMEHDSGRVLREVKTPILALYGEKDVQIDASSHAKALAEIFTDNGHTISKVETLPSLNHLFQTAKTGAMTEYQKIEETISELAMNHIVNWIQKLPR